MLEQRTTKERSFRGLLREVGAYPLRRVRTTTLQLNVGKRCNQACHHCHVEAGPHRTEMMSDEVAERVVELMAGTPGLETLDITGGAPELNPNFRRLVRAGRARDLEVIDRCNLTILFEPGQEDLASFLAEQRVRVVASLPCYQRENVEKQRGRGVFDKSIEGLLRLNELGFGKAQSGLTLDLVYNPVGAFLPPDQAGLEHAYKRELRELFGIEFNQLFTITNMPINRFADYLKRGGEYGSYMELLTERFNPATLPNLMCRSLVSVRWDGRLSDCDFNQMLDLECGAAEEIGARTIWEVESLDCFEGERVATGRHCLGCTAGAGSSCGGALD